MTIERQFRFGELRTGPRVGASAERRAAALATRTRRSCPSPCLLPWAVRGAGGGAGIAAPRASGAREGHGPQGPFPRRPCARGRRAAPSALRVRAASSPRRPRQLSLVVLMENSPRPRGAGPVLEATTRGPERSGASGEPPRPLQPQGLGGTHGRIC